MYRGSCLCGRITYVVNEELSDFGYCHCRSCRKASGSAFGANAGVRLSSVDLRDPQGMLRKYESSPGKIRTFCSNCGSPLYAYLTRSPELIMIRLGTLDKPLERSAKAHAFVGEKAPWYTIADGLPQFDQWASKDVLIQVGSRQSQ